MPLVDLPLGFGFYQSRVRPFASQRCINWMPVVAEGPSLSGRMLAQMPGLDLFATLPEAGNRGARVMDGVPYFVNGGHLYTVTSAGGFTEVGEISGAGRVSMADNGVYLVIVVPGGAAFTYNKDTNILAVITDTDFDTSDTVVYKDGYFVFSASSGKKFFNSALNDPTSYDPLDFGTAETSPDGIVSQHVDHNELFELGSESIEIFQNVGGTGFPFQRISGAIISKGCHAKFGIVGFDNTFSFIGGGLNERTAIWKVSGSSNAVKISSDAIDAQIQAFNEEEISTAFADTMAIDGQILAFFTFESTRIDSRTFVYNATASALSGGSVWFELSTNESRWRAQSIVRAFGKILAADNASGKIGVFNSESFLEFGAATLRQMTSTPFSQDGIPLFSGSLELLFESGVGLTLGQGSDPMASMDFSDDGGNTFSSETTRTMGKIGDYNRKSIWNRQGRFPVSRIIRISVADPVKANLMRISATVEAGF